MAQESSPPTPRRGPIPWRVLAPLTLMAIAALAYLATRPLGGGDAQPSFFVIGSARAGVQIGELAPGTAQAGGPRLELVGLYDEPVSLTDLEGQPIWLIFWKTACEPCEAEAEDVAAAVQAHEADGLAAIGIDLWDSAAVVLDYSQAHDLEVPVAVARGSAAMDAYGVWGAPTHYFIDRSGIIRGRYFGPMTRELIDEYLDRIIEAPRMDDRAFRDQLVRLLEGDDAHMRYEEAVADFPDAAINAFPPNVPYTPWHLLEHVRITQRDLLDYIIDADYQEPPWPSGYWPARDAVATPAHFAASITAFLADRDALRELVTDPATDLLGPMAHAPGHSVAREIRIAGDHCAYHVGEFAVLRQVMGTWPAGRR